MTPADRQTIVRKLGYLQKNVELLTEYRDLTVDELENKPEKRLALERLLQTGIESVVDCSRLLVTLQDWRKLRDERDAMIILGERSVLAEDLAERLLRAKGFRNVLVHEYVAVDPLLMLENLKSGLPDLRAFTVALAKWLEKE